MIQSALFCLALGMLAPSGFAQEVLGSQLADNLILTNVINPNLRDLEKVGHLGKSESLKFTGLKTFTPDQIRHALLRDFDVVLAGNPHANLKGYLQVLDKRLSEGFRKSGFPHAKVASNADPKTKEIQIAIEEGQRYLTGEVKVTGPKTVESKILIQYLTNAKVYQATTPNSSEKPQEDSDTPKLWKTGEQANFFEKPKQVYEPAIKAGLAALGYFFPEFEVTLTPAESGKANLHVNVKEVGPKAFIGSILLSGIQHHVKEELINYLGIKPGMEVDYKIQQAWEEKLVASRCFLRATVSVLPAIAPGAPSDLSIVVIEQPKGPLLGEELTENDKLFVKTSKWFHDWESGADSGDLVFVSRDTEEAPYRMLLILSPSKGMVAEFETSLSQLSEPIRYTLIITEQEQRLICWHQKRELRAKCFDGQFTYQLNFGYEADKESPSGWSAKTTQNIGYTSQREKGGQGPFAIMSNLPAEVAIATSRDSINRFERKANVLSLLRNGNRLQFDAQSGEILSFVSKSFEDDLAKLRKAEIPKLENDGGVAYFQPKAVERFQAWIKPQTKGFATVSNAQRPLSSVLEFFGKEFSFLNQFAKKQIPVDVFVKLIEADALRPLDLLWLRWQSKEDPEAEFEIPWQSEGDEKIQFFGLEKQLPPGFGKLLARVAFGAHGMIIPPDSGPARVGWNLGLLCVGRYEEGFSNLNRLAQSPEVGPLTLCYASSIFVLFNPHLKQQLAQAGLKKLSADHFRREMDALLPKESLLVELVQSLGNAVRQLDDDEFAQLATLLGTEAKHPMVPIPKMIAQLRQQQGTPSRELLIESLVMVWNFRGQARLQEVLEKLANPAGEEKINYDDLTLEKLFPDPKSKKDNEEKTDDLDDTVDKILRRTETLELDR